MRNFWHTNRLNWRSCATPPLFLQKNEKILAHKSPKLKIVCHASPIPPQKREIFGTQIAQIRNRVPLLTNLRRKMSNKRDRRRKGVIYPGQSGTGRSQNTFFTETEKEPFLLFSAGKWQDADCKPEECSDVLSKKPDPKVRL